MAFRSQQRGILSAGMHAPAFELCDAAGERHSLDALLKKAPVLLAFFKVSCPVCQLTFPFLERISRNNALQVVGISQDDVAATRKFNDRFGVDFLTLLDEAREGYAVSNAFGISSVPTLFVIETDGAISSSFAGFSKRELNEIGRRVEVRPFHDDEYVPEFKAG